MGGGGGNDDADWKGIAAIKDVIRQSLTNNRNACKKKREKKRVCFNEGTKGRP